MANQPVPASPGLVPYVSHFAAPPAGRVPTGFIAYDMPYYLANGAGALRPGPIPAFLQ